MVKNRRFENEAKVSGFGARHVQFVLLFFALFVAFATRVNLSIAIVAMMNNNSTTNATAVQSHYETYDWSEKTKSYILSSFFWGYCLTQLPGGQLARIFGSKIILLQAIFVTSVLTMLLPFAVRLGGWKLFVAVRIISGLSQGVLFPTAHTLVSRWAPAEERSTLGTCSYLGANVGTVVMLALSGTLASSRYGWPSSFYVSGGLGVIWSVAWFIWGASTPSDCKRITPEERLMIETSLGQVQSTQTTTKKRKLLKTPWSHIFKSAPFWAIAIVHCSDNWGFWTLLTQIPSYMKHVLGMDIKSNALLSALPYLVYILLSFLFCYISNMLQKHKCISLSNNRKLFTTISTWVPMISLIALGYVDADHVKLAVVLLIITVGFNASAYVGWVLNHMELSPNFGGVLMGLTNSTANVMSFLAPLSVGFIVENEQDPAQWRTVFFIAAGYYFVGNLLYLIFGSAKIQPWNDLTLHEKELQFVKVPTEPEESEK